MGTLKKKIKALLKRAITPVLIEVIVSGMLLSVSAVATAQQYSRTDLTSDIPGVAVTADSRFVNAWGLTAGPMGPWWVADNGSGVSTLYTGEGFPMPAFNPRAVHIPPGGVAMGMSRPTGIVYNGSADFAIAPDKPAECIFVTEDGTISGWNPEVVGYNHNAVLMVDNSSDAVYTGATIARMDGENYLYVANFRSGRVDVFGGAFRPVLTAEGAFTDPDIPDDFAPFNVQDIGGELYVAFAKQDADGRNAVNGDGLGYVDIFDTSGNLLMRLQQGPWMNAPWGMALAPDDFGGYSGHLLIGNSGSGTIAAYDQDSGEFKGFLRDSGGSLIAVEGLKGLSFGNGSLAGPLNALYFIAGIYGGHHGLFGSITPETQRKEQKIFVYPRMTY